MATCWRRLDALQEKTFMDKKWYSSKTLWTNLIAIITLISAYLVGDADIQQTIQQIVAPGLAVLNIILRLMTGSPIAGFGKRS